MATTPTLGYGKPTEVQIDKVNIWMRSTPWYQSLLRGWGHDPAHPGNLTKEQSRQILRQAQAQGVVVDEGDMEVDTHGNFNPKGHKLRNTLIVAGVAGAALATMGAAGVFGATALPAATGISGLSATSLGLPVTTGLGTAGAVGATSVAGAAGTGLGSMALRYGLPIGGDLAGTIIQSRAATNAAEIQDRYLREALAYEKEKDAYERQTESERYNYNRDVEASRYADREGRLSPYRATGQSANAQMAALLGLPVPAERPATLMARSTAPAPAPTTAPGPPVPATTAAPMAMVTLRAPDGTMKAVPQSQVDYYLSRGAERVRA